MNRTPTGSVTQGMLTSARPWKEPSKEGHLGVRAEFRGRGCHVLLCKENRKRKQFNYTWVACGVDSRQSKITKGVWLFSKKDHPFNALG